MQASPLLNTKNLTLVTSFAACYAISTFWTLFPIIGDYGRFITVASIIAPLIGMFLGPFLGPLTVVLGGTIAISTGAYSIVSLVAGAASAFCSGMLYHRRRIICAASYLWLLLLFAFYPVYGPAWSFPFFVWLHIVGLVVLVSPLMRVAMEAIRDVNDLRRNTFGVWFVVFVSILFGHLAGSLMFEIIYFPLFVPFEKAQSFSWQIIALQYPVERFIMVFAATVIGVSLNKTLRRLGFL